MKLKELHLLTDENIDPAVLGFLRQEGFDVVDIKEMGWQGKRDIEILEEAHKQQRVVVTQDDDFGKLVFSVKMPFTGIIYLRPGHFFPERTIQAFKTVFLQETLDYIPPFILVIDDKSTHIKIRLRNLS
jgi:predicted nuclease of predicted toxin-antitoxin system